MAFHIVGGIAWYTVGATRLRTSIHISLASVVAHTMGLQLPVAFLIQRVYQLRPIGWYVRFPDGDIRQARGQVSLEVQWVPAVEFRRESVHSRCFSWL